MTNTFIWALVAISTGVVVDGVSALRIETVGLAMANPTYTCLGTVGTSVTSLLTGNTQPCNFKASETTMNDMIQGVVKPVMRFIARSWHRHPKEPSDPVFLRPWHWLCSAAVMDLVPSKFQYASDEANATDFLVLVTFQANSFFGFGRVCQHHPVSKRPAIVMFNVASGETTRWRGSKFEMQIFVLHEMVHVFGMSDDYWVTNPTMFVDPDRGYAHLPQSEVLARAQRPEGHLGAYITTPRVVQFLRQNTGCATALGAELEDDGGLAFSGNHWESRLYTEDINTVVLSDKITNLTLSLLEDTGWLVVDYAHAQSAMLVKGYKRGCPALTNQCNNIPTSEDNTDFCIIDYQVERCTADKRDIAFCYLTYYNAVPYNERYLARFPTVGGLDFMEFCPGRFTRVRCGDSQVCIDRPLMRDSSCETPTCVSVTTEGVTRRIAEFNFGGAIHRCPEDGLPGRTSVNGVQLGESQALVCPYAEITCGGQNQGIDFTKFDLTFSMELSDSHAGAVTSLTFTVYLSSASAPTDSIVEITFPNGTFSCLQSTVSSSEGPDFRMVGGSSASSVAVQYIGLIPRQGRTSLTFTLANCVNPLRPTEDPGPFLIAVRSPSGVDLGYSFYNPPGDVITLPESKLSLTTFAAACVPVDTPRGFGNITVTGTETFAMYHALRLCFSLNVSTLGTAPHFIRFPPTTYFRGDTLQLSPTMLWSKHTLFVFSNLSNTVEISLFRNQSVILSKSDIAVVFGNTTSCFKVTMNLNVQSANTVVAMDVHPVPQCPSCQSTLHFKFELPTNETLETNDTISIRLPYTVTYYSTAGFILGNNKSLTASVVGAARGCNLTAWPVSVSFPIIDVRVGCRTGSRITFTLGLFRNPLGPGDPGPFGVVMTRGERLLFNGDINPIGDHITIDDCGNAKCQGHGTCDAYGACQCVPGFSGAACGICMDDFYPPGVCNATCVGDVAMEERRLMCGGRGLLRVLPSGGCGCQCDAGWCGDTCGGNNTAAGCNPSTPDPLGATPRPATPVPVTPRPPTPSPLNVTAPPTLNVSSVPPTASATPKPVTVPSSPAPSTTPFSQTPLPTPSPSPTPTNAGLPSASPSATPYRPQPSPSVSVAPVATWAPSPTPSFVPIPAQSQCDAICISLNGIGSFCKFWQIEPLCYGGDQPCNASMCARPNMAVPSPTPTVGETTPTPSPTTSKTPSPSTPTRTATPTPEPSPPTPVPTSQFTTTFFSLQILGSVLFFSPTAFSVGVASHCADGMGPENIKTVLYEQIATDLHRSRKVIQAIEVWFQFVKITDILILNKSVSALSAYVDEHSNSDGVLFGDMKIVPGSGLGMSQFRPSPRPTTAPPVMSRVVVAGQGGDGKGEVAQDDKRGINRPVMVVILCVSGGIILVIVLWMAIRCRKFVRIGSGRERAYEMTNTSITNTSIFGNTSISDTPTKDAS